MTGNKTITLTLKAKRSREFPRGELLSVGSDGAHNYAMDPVKVLAWIRDQNAKAREDGKHIESLTPADPQSPPPPGCSTASGS